MKFTKETLRRALRTFIQAAVGFLSSTGIAVLATNDFNVSKTIMIGLLGSAISTGLAAVMNLESPKSTGFGDIEPENKEE